MIRVCLNTDPELGLPSLADESFDHGIFDPPYSKHVHNKSRRGQSKDYKEPTRPNAKAAQIARNRDLGFEHITEDQRVYTAQQMARICCRWVLIFTDGESNHLWRAAAKEAGLLYVRTAYWHKLGAAPQFTGDRPADHLEHIVCFHRPGPKGYLKDFMRWNGGGRGNVYRYAIVQNRKGGRDGQRFHTTQKPLRLMEQLVRDFSNRGESILDPFAGSGTTLVAARGLGRTALGMEAEPRWAATAIERLAGVVEQTELPLVNASGITEQPGLAFDEGAGGLSVDAAGEQ